jgi:AcrR family transcriptional regulator
MKSDAMTSLRAEHVEQTRARILDAAIAQMSDAPVESLTVAGIAKRAGITERTIYRHFQTRDALLAAVWPRMQSLVGSRGFPQTAADLVATPRRLFPAFDGKEGLVRASVYSEAGREVRLRANDERQAAMIACVRDALPELEGAAVRARAAAVQLLNSAFAWSAMRDFWDLDGQAAGEAAAEAISILLGLSPASPKQESTSS